MWITHTLCVCIYIISVLWSCVDSWYVYITRNITSVPSCSTVYSRDYFLGSPTRTQTQTSRMPETRLRGKRTLLSNLRNWISRDIVASVARLMSEPFQSPRARLHHRQLIGRVFGREQWKSFFLSLYPWARKLFCHWEEEAMAIPFISPGNAKDVPRRINTNERILRPRDSLEFSLIS